MRSLSLPEIKIYNKKLNDMEQEMSTAKYNGMSKSALKRLKAKHHNEWQFFIHENQIINIFGKVYTERETPIEGRE